MWPPNSAGTEPPTGTASAEATKYLKPVSSAGLKKNIVFLKILTYHKKISWAHNRWTNSNKGQQIYYCIKWVINHTRSSDSKLAKMTLFYIAFCLFVASTANHHESIGWMPEPQNGIFGFTSMAGGMVALGDSLYHVFGFKRECFDGRVCNNTFYTGHTSL